MNLFAFFSLVSGLYLAAGVLLAMSDYRKGAGGEFRADTAHNGTLFAWLGLPWRVITWPQILATREGFTGLDDHDDEFPSTGRVFATAFAIAGVAAYVLLQSENLLVSIL